MVYIRRYGSSALPDPMPDQSLAAYRQALAAKYDHQIRLLRSAKFWCLLPMYLAVLVMLAGVLLDSALEHVRSFGPTPFPSWARQCSSPPYGG